MGHFLKRIVILALLCLFGQAGTAVAQGDPVRIDLAGSHLRDRGQGVDVALSLDRPTAYRVLLRDDPARVVIDLADADISELTAGTSADFNRADRVRQVTVSNGPSAGWSRLTLILAQPMLVAQAGLETSQDSGARLHIRLRAASDAEFSAALSPMRDGLVPSQPTIPAVVPQDRARPVVALDPGHGGLDPGAERDGYKEADLVLLFALELREMLLREGRVDVFMTRERDEFVPLPHRMSRARMAGADVFISIHADALAEGTGSASGATVYTLSETGSDAASAALAAQHDRADLLAGVDLARSDDVVADLLMDLARRETDPRSAALADALVAGLDAAGVELHSRPRLEANFTVLRAPDYPSVLLEIGYMSQGGDLDNILDPAWRAQAQSGITRALEAWLAEDNLRRSLMRR
ncbi:N-acetylmuramoyl-L-alanine amidase [Rhodobacteraceae bacterium XHP0102]|nr:N-acetylmuramoyl-L-alanine amidase [Rhodobacteraceae bacterium XHP0102]